MMTELELSGFGLKLHHQHYQEILATNPLIDWFEILSENYLGVGGLNRYYLQQISERYPITMHGVSMSLGSSDPLDYKYLASLKQLAKETEAKYISDHLCWTGLNHINSHDLLPMPYTEEAIKHLVTRISQVQDYLGRQILIENVSSYLTYNYSDMTEWEFITRVATNADCLILLDINNVYVSAINHDFNPLDYLNYIPPERIAQIHLAGHSVQEQYLIDSHDSTISEPVWQLYSHAMATLSSVPTLIERDENIPPLDELVAELNYARKIAFKPIEIQIKQNAKPPKINQQ